jgi:uncharacterized protein YndB with AHSA1/START domain
VAPGAQLPASTRLAVADALAQPSESRQDGASQFGRRFGWRGCRESRRSRNDRPYATGGIYREIMPPETLVFSWGAVGGWPRIHGSSRFVVNEP